MGLPERLKPKSGGYATLLVVLAVPVSIGGLLLLVAEIALRLGWADAGPSWAWRAGEARKLPAGDLWLLMLWGVDLVAATWLNWIFHKQVHTYTPLKFSGGLLSRLGTGLLWLLGKGLFFGIMMILGLFLVVPVMIVLTGLAMVIGLRTPDFQQRIVADAALLLGLSTAVVGLTAFSRALWFWSALKQVVLLPSAPGAAVPQGLAEIRGVARPATEPWPEGKPLLGTSPMFGERDLVGPFVVETGGTRIRVEPPGELGIHGGQILLAEGSSHGEPVLMPGDPVLVLGRLERGETGAVMRPEVPARPGIFFTGRRRFLSVPDLFLVAGADEAGARRRLHWMHVRWLGLGAFFVAGGVLVALLGLAARVDPLLLGRLASAGGFK